MGWFQHIKNFFRRRPQRAVFDRSKIKNPLREFIYLDEVSLRSLLSSKKGEMTATTSKEVSRSTENESRDTVGLDIASVGKMEATSRFQTRNSSSLQTAKKATVQSWFRELDQLQNIRLLETVHQVVPFETSQELSECSNFSVCVHEDKLRRGEIVEFRVRLSADPIFHMITLFSEFKAMASDFPEMMTGHGGLKVFHEVEGIGRVIQRLLAGLIPVRAEALDYAVVEVGGRKYVVHKDAISGLNIESEPLELVCVTELDAYWKDIRRVLFSDAEFTILARISKSKIQTSWTPIKLADLMKGLVPDLSEQLNNATRFLFDPDRVALSQVGTPSKLRDSLHHYSASLLEKTEISETNKTLISAKVNSIDLMDESATAQKQAFVAVHQIVSDLVNLDISPDENLAFREKARAAAGLEYFASNEHTPTVPVSTKTSPVDNERPMLDVEVVAMYW